MARKIKRSCIAKSLKPIEWLQITEEKFNARILGTTYLLYIRKLIMGGISIHLVVINSEGFQPKQFETLKEAKDFVTNDVIDRICNCLKLED